MIQRAISYFSATPLLSEGAHIHPTFDIFFAGADFFGNPRNVLRVLVAVLDNLYFLIRTVNIIFAFIMNFLEYLRDFWNVEYIITTDRLYRS